MGVLRYFSSRATKRDMWVPFSSGGRATVRGPVGHGALGRTVGAFDQHGMAHAADADALDRDVTRVRGTLDIGHHDGGINRRIHFGLPVWEAGRRCRARPRSLLEGHYYRPYTGKRPGKPFSL